jgi:hypothetical protein
VTTRGVPVTTPGIGVFVTIITPPGATVGVRVGVKVKQIAPTGVGVDARQPSAASDSARSASPMKMRALRMISLLRLLVVFPYSKSRTHGRVLFDPIWQAR